MLVFTAMYLRTVCMFTSQVFALISAWTQPQLVFIVFIADLLKIDMTDLSHSRTYPTLFVFFSEQIDFAFYTNLQQYKVFNRRELPICKY